MTKNNHPDNKPDLTIIRNNQIQGSSINRKTDVTRPILHSDFKGAKFVPVGDMIVWSDNYRTFIDFLADYGRIIIEDKLKTHIHDDHEIVKWYDEMRSFQQKQKPAKNNLAYAMPNGAMRSFIHLAYDLYILQHHMLLQDRIIQRLGNKDQFQGARHELYAIAVCIRSGFNVEYADDSCNPEKHTEFIATHKITGQKIEIEVKSRHRDGVLGRSGEQKKDKMEDSGFSRKFKDALKKKVKYPYVIFIDLNLSPSQRLPTGVVLRRAVERTVKDVCGTINIYDPYNLIIVTNKPYYYDTSDRPAPAGANLFIDANRPKIKVKYPSAFSDLWNSITYYENVPLYFPDNDCNEDQVY